MNLNARKTFNVRNNLNNLKSLKLLFNMVIDGKMESRSITAIGVNGYIKKDNIDFLSFKSAVMSLIK